MEEKIKSTKGRLALFVLLTFPFYQLGCLVDTISWAGKAYTLCQLCAGAVLAFLFARHTEVMESGPARRSMPLFAGLTILLAVMCLASIRNGGSLKRALEYSYGTLMVCLLILYGMATDLRTFVTSQILFFGTLTGANLITILLFPEGLYTWQTSFWCCWLLGFKSAHITYQLQFLFYALLYTMLFDREKKRILLLGAAGVFLSNMLADNKTAQIALLPVIFAMLVPSVLKRTAFFNSLIYSALGVAANLTFVVFRAQEAFAWLIVGVFHRSLTLTDRTLIWDAAIRAIWEHPLIGHGYQTFVYEPFPEVITTHNEMLELLYKTGILGFTVFLGLIVVAIVRLFLHRKKEAAQWTALFLGVFFLMFVVEQHAFAHFFYLLLFAFCIGETEFTHL